MNKEILASLGPTVAAQFGGLDFEIPSSWPWLPRLFLLLGLYCLIFSLFCLYPLSDYADEFKNLLDKENTLRAQFTEKRHKAESLHLLKKQRDELALTVKALEQQLPRSTEMANLLFGISQVGRTEKLQQELFKPDAPIFKEYYVIVPVTFRANGGYHDFARFAANVANLQRIVNLSNITIWARPDGGLTLETTIRAYRHLDANEGPAQAKAAEVAK